MRQGSSSRRSRGRGNNRRQNLSLRNQTFDSNGPDVRIRGNAFQVYDKYLALARDASSVGDRIAAENYLQHAEHYQRIIAQINETNGEDTSTQPHNGQQGLSVVDGNKNSHEAESVILNKTETNLPQD